MKLLQVIDEIILDIYMYIYRNMCRNIYPNARHSNDPRAICLCMVIYVNEHLRDARYNIPIRLAVCNVSDVNSFLTVF